MTRRCSVCKKTQPLKTSYFERSKNKSGFNYWCKMCCSNRNQFNYKRRRLEQFSQLSIKPLEEVERDAIAQAIEASHGNLRLAAKCLGIGKATIYRKVNQYNLKPETKIHCKALQLIHEMKELEREWKELRKETIPNELQTDASVYLVVHRGVVQVYDRATKKRLFREPAKGSKTGRYEHYRQG